MSAALKTSAKAKAMRTTKYPPEFQQKVDMSKVNLPVIKKWASDEVARLLGSDDDVVIEMIFNIIEGSKSPNIKQLQYDLTGFLDKDAPSFCLNLWKLCLDGQDSPNGIPKSLLEAKKLELIQEKLAEDRARELAEQRQQEEREREREMARIRDRERGSRGRGGRGGGRRGRDRDYSRSPPPRRRDAPRVDSYVPGGRGRGRDDPQPQPPRRRRSPSYGRSPSRSRSPPRRRRRRNSSSDISDKADNKSRRTRSPSPRRKRRSPSSNDDRSPPPRRCRARDDSSRSRSPPRKRQSRFGSGDLMSNTDRKKDRLEAPRLSREGSEFSEPAAHGGAKPDESARHPQQSNVFRGSNPPNPLKISREELQARLSMAKAEAARKRKDSAPS